MTDGLKSIASHAGLAMCVACLLLLVGAAATDTLGDYFVALARKSGTPSAVFLLAAMTTAALGGFMTLLLLALKAGFAVGRRLGRS